MPRELEITDELARARRARALSSASHQSLIHAANEGDLLRDTCRIAVEVGGYRMAWIGRVDPDVAAVRPLAHAGFDDGYLAATDAVWSELAGPGGGPRVTADVRRDPAFGSRRAEAERRGYRSAIVLPLASGGRVCGVLEIYAIDADAFDVAEVELLTELATGVAYGLSALGAVRGGPVLTTTDREREYRSLAENTPDMVVRWDRELRRVYVNPAFCAAVGMPAEQILGTPLGTQFTGPVTTDNAEYLAGLAASIRSVLAGAEPIRVELPWVGLYGTRIIDHRLVPERGPDGTVETVLGIGRDITALKQSERQVRTLTEHSPDIIMRCDTEGRYLYANAAVVRATGVPAEQYIGRIVGDVIGRPGADDEPLTPFVLLRRGVIEACAADAPVELELEFTLATGRHAFNVRIIPEHDERGAAITALVVARDVTEQRKLEAQLRQAQKMEAVGQLAGGIAHDFNNMLAVIQMQSTLALMAGTELDDIHDCVRDIMQASERAANLTRTLLTFSRQQTARPMDLDIGAVIGNMTKLLGRVLGDHIELELRLAPALPIVHADAGMLEQVLMNLGINARDAMPDGGRLSVGLDTVEVGDAQAARHPGAAAGLHVCLAVGDTGCGISAAELPRIFEPFFTTKEVGKGTGLGLATVFGIVQQHHGWIDVDSEVGRGTTFRVYLPAVAAVGAGAATASRAAAVRGGDETILLVEDEDAVRAITRNALERYGYRVIEATSGSTALARWDAAPEPPAIDLLITDLIMPGGVSGAQLAEQLRARAPGLKVIYISGSSRELINRMLQEDPDHTLLPKPFATADLAATVRRVLDGGGE
jgi:PAS domain S-box-containing protein